MRLSRLEIAELANVLVMMPFNDDRQTAKVARNWLNARLRTY